MLWEAFQASRLTADAGFESLLRQAVPDVIHQCNAEPHRHLR